MSTDQAYQRLQLHPELPSPQGIALEIMRLARSPECTLSELARLVEADPAIASRLIRLVNSSAFPHNRPIISLTEAIAYLGTRTVECIALCFSLVSAKTRCRSFDYVRFWSEGLARAVSGCRVARELSMDMPDEVFTVALLSRLGQLVFATTHPDQYNTLLSAIRCDRHSLLVLERELFEIDHVEVTARLMSDWGWPDRVCSAVRLQYETGQPDFEPKSPGGRLATTLALASLMSEQMLFGMCENRGPADLMAEADRAGLSIETVADLIRDAVPQWREMVSIFSLEQLDEARISELCCEAARLRETISVRDSA